MRPVFLNYVLTVLSHLLITVHLSGVNRNIYLFQTVTENNPKKDAVLSKNCSIFTAHIFHEDTKLMKQPYFAFQRLFVEIFH